MKWFKHMVASWNDEELAKLVGKGGMEGLAMYGFYWRVIEVVAPHGGKVTYPTLTWAHYCGLKIPVMNGMFLRLHSLGIFKIENLNGDEICVAIPETLVREDEGTRLPWHIWKEIRVRIFSRDNYVCRYCQRVVPRPECDHVVPVSRGGGHDDANLVTACQPCNRSKSSKMAEEYR